LGIEDVDELQHQPTDEPLWRESLYFSFHDGGGEIGGMTTIGIYPNQNQVEGFAAIFLPSPGILLHRTEGTMEPRQAGLFSVRQISYEMLAPLQRWRLIAAADFDWVEPEPSAQGVHLVEEKIPAGFDLSFDACSPVYEFPPISLGLLKGAARRFEQTGRVKGTVFVDGKTLPLRGLGFRDHSWGVHDFSGLGHVVTLYAQFSPRWTVNAVWGIGHGHKVAAGYVCRDGVNVAVDDVQVELESDPLSDLPRLAQAEIRTADGRSFRLQAQPRSVLPILLRQGEKQMHWYECSTHFADGQQRGFGIMEVTRLARQVRSKGMADRRSPDGSTGQRG